MSDNGEGPPKFVWTFNVLEDEEGTSFWEDWLNSSSLFMLTCFDWPWNCCVVVVSAMLLRNLLWYSTRLRCELVIFLLLAEEERSSCTFEMCLEDIVPSLVYFRIGISFLTVLRSILSITSSSRMLFPVLSPDAELFLPYSDGFL